MGITLMTGAIMVVGLVLLAMGASRVKKDWEPTPLGKAVDQAIYRTYPNKGSTLYAIITTIEWLMDLVMSLSLPIAAGWMLDPYSGPFVGAVLGVVITIWRWRWRSDFERKLALRRKRKQTRQASRP